MLTNSYDLTILIIKPDLDTKSLRAELMRRLADSNLTIVFQGLVCFNLESVRKFYQWDEIVNPSYIQEYLCSKPLEYLIIYGKDAIIKVHNIKMQMRTEFSSLSEMGNLMHCSDSPQDFQHELFVLLELNR